MNKKNDKNGRYCSAFGCLHSNKSNPDLSLFTLPKDPERRKEWLTIIGREDLLNKKDLKHNSYSVCHVHFKESAMKTKSVRKLQGNAVPVRSLCDGSQNIPSTSYKQPDPLNIYSESGSNLKIQVCRTCLAYDTRMYNIADTPLQKFYEKITNLPLNFNSQDERMSVVCYICYHILKKCLRFAESAVKADEVLQQRCTSGIQLTKQYFDIFHKRQFLTFYKTTVFHANATSDATRDMYEDIDIPNVENEEKNKHEEMAVDSTSPEDNHQEHATHYQIKKEEIEVDETQYHLHRSSDSDDEKPLQRLSTKKDNEAVEQGTGVGSKGPVKPSKILEASSSDEKGVDVTSKKKDITLIKNVKKNFDDNGHVKNTDKKPYTYNYCKTIFSKKKTSLNHIQRYTDEKLFKCDYCGHTFAKKYLLQHHLRTLFCK